MHQLSTVHCERVIYVFAQHLAYLNYDPTLIDDVLGLKKSCLMLRQTVKLRLLL